MEIENTKHNENETSKKPLKRLSVFKRVRQVFIAFIIIIVLIYIGLASSFISDEPNIDGEYGKERVERIYNNLFVKKQYTYDTNGTLYDVNTDLTWMRCSLGQSYKDGGCSGTAKDFTWKQALSVAEQTHFACASDWRLPTIEELESIVYCSSGKRRQIKLTDNGDVASGWTQHGRMDGRCLGNYKTPAISLVDFPTTKSTSYWSASSDSEGEPMRVWFENGSRVPSWNDSAYAYPVRLVRTGQ